MPTIEFRVRSSTGDAVYELVATAAGGAASFSCTCEGARQGSACKHRLNLLAGNHSIAIDAQPAHIDALISMMRGTQIQAALSELSAAERHADEAKKRVSKAKKSLARAMTP